MKKLNILYVRVSTVEQKTDRQRVNEADYDLVVEDTCSGIVPFFDREGGKKILKLINKGAMPILHVYQIDRLGRDIRDILNTIHFFNERKIPIKFVAQGLQTLDEEGTENPITQMIITIMGVIGQMERTQIKEWQKAGIEIAKAKGIFLGRKSGTKEDTVKFLSKPKNQKVVEYLKRGMNATEASKLAGVHINTVTKIKQKAF